jgi:hypothetical protein
MKAISRQFTLLIWAFFLLCCCVVLPTLICLADTQTHEQQINDFCERVLNTAKINRESIRTWKGNLSVKLEFFDPKTQKSTGKLQAKIDFAIDVVKNMQISVAKIIDDKRIEDDSVFRERPRRIIGFLFRDNLTYAFDGVDPKGPIINPANVLGSPTAAYADSSKPYVKVDKSISPANLLGSVRIIPGMEHPVVHHFPSPEFHDPFYGLSLGKEAWLNINSLVKLLKKGTFSYINYDMVILETNNSSGTTILRLLPHVNSGNITTEYEFDKNGLCIREYGAESVKQKVAGRYECILETDYIKINGIWVPNKIRVVLEHAKLCFEYTFNDQVINEPLDDDAFSLKALGVKQGDWVKDLRTDASYPIDDPSLPKHDFDNILNRRDFSMAQIILISFGTILLLSALIRVYLKWRAKRKEVK